MSPDERTSYDPPQRVRTLPSWMASEVARRAHQLVGDELAREGARRPHFTILTSLSEQGAASQADLGRRLSIDRSDLHGLLNELEAGGLVARVRDRSDRRRNVVAITPAGSAALKRLDKRIDAAQRALLEPLSAREQQELRRLLEQILARAG
jgi:DNA-binding MarR family transcriptional regulator